MYYMFDKKFLGTKMWGGTKKLGYCSLMSTVATGLWYLPEKVIICLALVAHNCIR